MNEIFYNSPLDIEIKSFTEVNDFIFPLRVHIKNIKYNNEQVIFLKTILHESEPSKDILLFGTQNSPYQKQYELNKYFHQLKFIYQHIDWELMDDTFQTFADLIGVYSEKDFIQWYIETDIFSLDSIITLSRDITHLTDHVKSLFLEKLIVLFGLDKEVPVIPLKQQNKNPDHYAEFLSYNFNMASFQVAAEFPMSIWFQENMGKAYTEWSWREQEAKRIYMTAKTRVENFRELVKAKQMEEAYSKK